MHHTESSQTEHAKGFKSQLNEQTYLFDQVIIYSTISTQRYTESTLLTHCS